MDDLLINTHVILCPAQVQKEMCVNVLRHVLQHFLPEKDVPSYFQAMTNRSRQERNAAAVHHGARLEEFVSGSEQIIFSPVVLAVADQFAKALLKKKSALLVFVDKFTIIAMTW